MRISVDITDELNEKLEAERKRLGLTKAALVISILNKKFMADEENKQLMQDMLHAISSNEQLADLFIQSMGNRKSE